MAHANENFIFKDYGTTRDEMNATLKTITEAIDRGTDVGVTGDDVVMVMQVLNSLINRFYGMPDELTEE